MIRGASPGSFRPRWRLISGREIGLGPGKADLLEAIEHAGSISGAARKLGMSYRRAWLLVATMNRCFRAPLVSTSRQRRRGAALTDDGRKVLILYRAIESRSLAATRALRSDLIGMLRKVRASAESRRRSAEARGGSRSSS